jgi:hypothetical protein
LIPPKFKKSVSSEMQVLGLPLGQGQNQEHYIYFQPKTKFLIFSPPEASGLKSFTQPGVVFHFFPSLKGEMKN